MYKQKPVFHKKGVDSKTYLRRLVGRINRLRKMIEFRESTKITEVQSHIDGIDKQILQLQKERDKWISKKDSIYDEISEIQSEIKDYTHIVKQVMSDETKPLFQVYKRTKKSKIGGRDYEYFEGRVRSRMRKGFLMKDKYYHLGDFNTCRRKIKEEYNLQLPSDVSEEKLKKELLKWVEDKWLRDLDKTSF